MWAGRSTSCTREPRVLAGRGDPRSLHRSGFRPLRCATQEGKRAPQDRAGAGAHDPAIAPGATRRKNLVIARRIFLWTRGGSILTSPLGPI
jgi:hypothetical protein